jgi:hypothetical protein
MRHGTEPVVPKPPVSQKEVVIKPEPDISKRVRHMKDKNMENSAVQRLLRHLRKAKLEQI